MARRNKGVTLVEILLAMVVLAIGLLGILAVFPAAIQMGKASMEDVHSALLAESVSHALVGACRNAQGDAEDNQVRITLNGATLELPERAGEWVHYPGGQKPAGPERDPYFFQRFPKSDLVDGSDPADQFQYSLDVRKRETGGRLYDVRIHVLRGRALVATFPFDASVR